MTRTCATPRSATSPITAYGSWRLTADARAAGRCQRIVQDQLDLWELGDRGETVQLLVGEVLRRTARYDGGQCFLRLVRRSGTLRCEIEDAPAESTADAEAHSDPADRMSAEPPRGPGVALVEMLASNWGTRNTFSGRAFWFDIDTAP